MKTNNIFHGIFQFPDRENLCPLSLPNFTISRNSGKRKYIYLFSNIGISSKNISTFFSLKMIWAGKQHLSSRPKHWHTEENASLTLLKEYMDAVIHYLAFTNIVLIHRKSEPEDFERNLIYVVILLCDLLQRNVC